MLTIHALWPSRTAPRSVLIGALALLAFACSSPTAQLPTAAPPQSPSTSAAAMAESPDAGPSTAPESTGSTGRSEQSGGSEAPDASRAAATGASTDARTAWLAFAACLRQHGFDVPDPQVNDAGQPDFGTVDIGSMLTGPVEQDCEPLVANVTSSKPAPKVYDFNSLLRHAACLRANGLPNYPDPDPNAAVQQLAPGYDKRDPTVAAALTACHSVLVQLSGPTSGPNQ